MWKIRKPSVPAIIILTSILLWIFLACFHEYPWMVLLLFIGPGFIVVGVFAIRVHVRQFTQRDRRMRGLCIHCGYDLTGNVSSRCPECGTFTGKVGEVQKLNPDEHGVKLSRWFRLDGDSVTEGEEICSLISHEGVEIVAAWESGTLKTLVDTGTIMVGNIQFARIIPDRPLDEEQADAQLHS